MPGEVVAEVKSILWWVGSTANVDPPDARHFGLRAQVFIGTRGDSASDSFDAWVCSPSWFAEQMAKGETAQFGVAAPLALPKDATPAAGVWLMPEWSSERFQETVARVCEIFSPAPDWGSLASRIGRLLPWEFDAHYDEHVNSRFGEPFPAVK